MRMWWFISRIYILNLYYGIALAPQWYFIRPNEDVLRLCYRSAQHWCQFWKMSMHYLRLILRCEKSKENAETKYWLPCFNCFRFSRTYKCHKFIDLLNAYESNECRQITQEILRSLFFLKKTNSPRVNNFNLYLFFPFFFLCERSFANFSWFRFVFCVNKVPVFFV